MRELAWLRSDLRLHDNPLLDADTAMLYVLDPQVWASRSAVQRAWLGATLRDLAARAPLLLRAGDPAEVVPAAAAELGADRVRVAREFTPAGVRRDTEVSRRLRETGIEAGVIGSAYAVDPGTLLTQAETPYKVFTPFSRAWSAALDSSPEPWARTTASPAESGATSDASAWEELDRSIAECPIELPEPGEKAALARWSQFREHGLLEYEEGRDRLDRDGTSAVSAYLRLGVLHPRSLLADLDGDRSGGAQRYRLELAWRDFYADVLLHHPESAWHDLNPLDIAYDDAGPLLEAWKRGETGFPVVDAGMRQLAATGWMHNRARMITASFLTKDLHVWWPYGARHFMDLLLDGDLASNSHGWQWVAGTGTDATPYFRVFNPITQGKRFDPQGEYVRRWVPELRGLSGSRVHEPWKHGGAPGYPEPIVDHAEEREEALRRYQGRSQRDPEAGRDKAWG